MTDESEQQTGSIFARLADIAAVGGTRLTERRDAVVAAGVLMFALVGFGGLPVPAAATGVAAFVVWALAWPSRPSSAVLAEYENNRRQAEAYRDASRAVWVALVEGLPDPAIALDGRGGVLAANGLASELFGGAQAGRHISQITRAPELLAAVDTALASRESQSCRMDFKVPVERSLVGTVAPLRTVAQDTETPQLIVVLRDLTEQDRLVRMRADFVANASHELRTPLASLKGFVETLQDAAKDDPEARGRFLKIMQQQAERMARLIDDLLSLSRIEMRAHVMPRDAIDLAMIVAHVVQTLAPIAKEKAIAIDVSPVSKALVTGDRDELIQVFQNLIENAIKYSRTGGRVGVRTEVSSAAQRPGRITVSITDDGPGIAAEHLPRLTERFYRVNATQSRNAGGTGLGLAIVKHVLNRHQAELHIESVIGQGSTFRVTFPLRENQNIQYKTIA
ncbi:MAG: phosphate regulon sensor histidine kinase PhoR [Hyphomicrobium sp.]|nr:phosphate regulon sensor histidine kinase PhoR [Hyphomicrobium sp.]